jgi:hypothetical protein
VVYGVTNPSTWRGAHAGGDGPTAVTRKEMTVKRIRLDKPGIRHERPGTEDLPADPRDPDVVRAKALARSQLTGSGSNRGQ